MYEHVQSRKSKTSWGTFGMLMALTVAMLSIGHAGLSRMITVPFQIVGMLLMAGLIGANYMHLRNEKFSFVALIAGGIFLTSAAMFFLLAPDGMRVLQLTPK